MQALLVNAAHCAAQLERPQEVVGLSEGWAHCVDLMDQILNTDDVVLAKLLQRMMRQAKHAQAYMCTAQKAAVTDNVVTYT